MTVQEPILSITNWRWTVFGALGILCQGPAHHSISLFDQCQSLRMHRRYILQVEASLPSYLLLGCNCYDFLHRIWLRTPMPQKEASVLQNLISTSFSDSLYPVNQFSNFIDSKWPLESKPTWGARIYLRKPLYIISRF